MMQHLAKYIDHTLLKQDATFAQIDTLCQEAKQYDFMSVCIQPHFVSFAKQKLVESSVKVCTVIGFPLGQNTRETKVFETKKAIGEGADEIDMVLNISLLKAAKFHELYLEIADIKYACQGRILKVILETCLLTNEEIIKACEIAKEAKVDFVKTSTGFSTSGATVEHVRLMKKTVGDKVQVKASGGVRSLADMQAMIEAGATRIGTSSGIKILQGQTSQQAY
jgi:deoxyribose-phosphate aldolase